MIVEICAGSLQSAINAQNGGAQRVELCANLSVGGTTPSKGTIDLAIKHIDIEIAVLIRPRAGGFEYNALEKEQMIENIRYCSSLQKINAIVVGALTKDRRIDIKTLEKFKENSRHKDIVFHRAFDVIEEPLSAIDELVTLGFRRILSSGQKETALKGADNLNKYNQYANGRINFMAGGGINTSNVVDIINLSGLNEIHSSAKTVIKNDNLNKMHFDSYYESSEIEVRKLVNTMYRHVSDS